MHVCVCVIQMCVCVQVCIPVHGNLASRGGCQVVAYSVMAAPYSLETESLIDPGSKLVASKLRHDHTWLFT